MVEVLPAILATNEADFKAHLDHAALRNLAPMWHIDILDGSMFDASCWADPRVVGAWPDLPEFEIHIMTHNPLPIIDEWHKSVPTLRRAIWHAEVARPLGAIIERATQLGLETGLALNPETTLERVTHHLHDLDVLQIMGVHPGASGQAFLGESILAKIRRARAQFPALAISLDGGVSTQNARAIIGAGVTRLVASSALWSSHQPDEVYTKLATL